MQLLPNCDCPGWRVRLSLGEVMLLVLIIDPRAFGQGLHPALWRACRTRTVELERRSQEDDFTRRDDTRRPLDSMWPVAADTGATQSTEGKQSFIELWYLRLERLHHLCHSTSQSEKANEQRVLRGAFSTSTARSRYVSRERLRCHDPEQPANRSRLLFQSNGAAWKPSRLTAILKKATSNVSGCIQSPVPIMVKETRLYDQLGIKPDANQQQIKKAYQ
ncbi:Uncharacterized protein TPAR_04773 [Tolypocladium paradoxum]|uniref:J domain-containing protein n=1 Tax=Tolypocladium paradoxum TaxID=94208 RepID=A0A2S4KXX6_9HYPO|nr:Uncharacterized protein TPAR_04773 [Tolypocladium paradoxum]